MLAIETHNLSKRFGDTLAVRVLELRIPKGIMDAYSINTFNASSAVAQNFFIFAAAFASGSFMCWATTWHFLESFGRNAAATLVSPSSQVIRRDLFAIALRIVTFEGSHFCRNFSSVHALNALLTGA